MKIPWKKLSSEIVYQNKWYSIRKDKVIRPDNKEGEYNVLVGSAAVFIVALNEKQEIILINSYRYPTERFSIEVPAGGVEDEEPIDAAKRELEEETGMVAKKWTPLGEFQMANGYSNGMGYTFLAEELTETGNNKQAEEGILGIQKATFLEVFQMIKSGEITDGKTIVAISMAAIKLEIKY